MFFKIDKRCVWQAAYCEKEQVVLICSHHHHVQPVSARGNTVFCLIFAIRITADFLGSRARMKSNSSKVPTGAVQGIH
jgi:hypothetical protein